MLKCSTCAVCVSGCGQSAIFEVHKKCMQCATRSSAVHVKGRREQTRVHADVHLHRTRTEALGSHGPSAVPWTICCAMDRLLCHGPSVLLRIFDDLLQRSVKNLKHDRSSWPLMLSAMILNGNAGAGIYGFKILGKISSSYFTCCTFTCEYRCSWLQV